MYGFYKWQVQLKILSREGRTLTSRVLCCHTTHRRRVVSGIHTAHITLTMLPANILGGYRTYFQQLSAPKAGEKTTNLLKSRRLKRPNRSDKKLTLYVWRQSEMIDIDSYPNMKKLTNSLTEVIAAKKTLAQY